MQRMQKEWKRPIEGLIKKFPSIYQFCNGDLNNFFCYQKKVFISMNAWIAGKNLIKTSLPPKEDFYSELNLECISNKDYVYTQKVWEIFEINNCGEYHDLYV